MTNSTRYKIAFLIGMSFIAAFSAMTAWAGSDQLPPRILVTGEGRVDVAPDMAVLSLTVMREAETARTALDANNAAMNDIFSAMKKEGIKEKDLQTSQFSIQPKYVYHPVNSKTGQRPQPEITGYTVRNSLSVRIRDITAVGRILDLSVSLGVNEGGNIRFANSDPTAIIAQAREKAVKDALTKADTLAKAAGVSAGRILEISERSYKPGPVPMVKAEMSMMRASDAVPVATGENAYSVEVNVTFAIEQ